MKNASMLYIKILAHFFIRVNNFIDFKKNNTSRIEAA